MWVNEGARASQAETVHSQSRMLFRFWEAMRGERSAPYRSDLDLKQARKLMPHLFIAEQQADGFRWRLAGTAIGGLFRREVTGGDMLAGWDDAEAQMIRRFLCGVTATHQPALLRMRFTTDREQAIEAEMAAFPLLASDGASTQVFGGLFTFPQAQLKDHARITAQELLGARFALNEVMAALAEDPQPQGARRFRVISGGLDQL